MLQHGFLDDWTYSVRTLQDNVSLVTPALLQELNALLVREGHAVAGKPPGTALDGRVDSFVVETDVHYPTDVNSCVKNFLQFPVGAETRPYR